MGRNAKINQYSEEEMDVWKRLCDCEGQTFKTLAGLEFSFSVRGYELFFDRKAKSITLASVMQGYRIAKKLVDSGVIIKGPKQIGTFGASYLLPLLQKLGVC